MAFRRKRVDRDNHERWLISYADFITLLFAFFVVMYAISSVNEGKYKVLGSSLGLAFGANVPKSGEAGTIRLTEQEIYFKSIVDRRNARMAEQQRKQSERMQNLVSTLNQVMATFVKNGQMSVSQTSRGVVLDINASALFAPGDAVLAAAAQKTLAEVAKVLVDGDQPIEVEGHTDNLPISTAMYPSNWELSSARASSVVRLFIEQGVVAKRLTAAGSADNHPVLSNDTPEGRTRNRRVTITVLTPEPERGTSTPQASTETAASGVAP
ncbi:MAG: flagellar motor protein MotD [Gallionellaceae bacterium]|nr:MAG: flagellar motor protein MotD [Gallionellaceae bacterium]